MNEDRESPLRAGQRVLFKSPPRRVNPAFREFEGTIVTVMKQIGEGDRAEVFLLELKDHTHADFCYRFRLQPVNEHPNRIITIVRKGKETSLEDV